jgi:hypothetical protein
MAPGAFQSRPLIASILSTCKARIIFCISGGILAQCLHRSLYVPTQCQIHGSKTEFCIPLYVSASYTTRRKLPPAQFSKECFTAVTASNIHSGVTSLVKWDEYGRCVKLHLVFSKKVLAISPSSEQCRNFFFGI